MDDLPHILVRSSVLKRQLSTWGATAQPDGSRPGNTSPTYPVCRQSAQVSGMPSCSQSQTARPVGLCTRTAHPCTSPREAGLTDGLFSKTGFTGDLGAEAAASGGRILLLTLDELYGQSS
jgi:hypothetical protein